MCESEAKITELVNRLNNRSRQVTIQDIATATEINVHWLQKFCIKKKVDIKMSHYFKLVEYCDAHNL